LCRYLLNIWKVTSQTAKSDYLYKSQRNRDHCTFYIINLNCSIFKNLDYFHYDVFLKNESILTLNQGQSLNYHQCHQVALFQSTARQVHRIYVHVIHSAPCKISSRKGGDTPTHTLQSLLRWGHRGLLRGPLCCMRLLIT